MNKKRNNKGFSLVELIVVVAIMAVLVGVLAPAYLRYVEKSRVQKDTSAVAEVVEAIKIAAANEAVEEEIGSDSTKPATVKITASTGAITVTKSTGITDSNTNADLEDEINASIGSSINLSSDELTKSDITIKVWKNGDGNVTIDVTGVKALDSLDEGTGATKES